MPVTAMILVFRAIAVHRRSVNCSKEYMMYERTLNSLMRKTCHSSEKIGISIYIRRSVRLKFVCAFKALTSPLSVSRSHRLI